MSDFSQQELKQFTGSVNFFRHHFNRAVIYTEGVQYLAENGKAYWLIDAIASHIGTQPFQKAVANDDRIELLHIWNLAVQDDRSAKLTTKVDSGVAPFIEQRISYTDFTLQEIDIWAGNNGQGFTLMLPSEY